MTATLPGSWVPAEEPAAPPAAEPAPERPVDDARPRWALPALSALLGGTALLYLWGLGASGWANAYYSAAAQAGASSWTAWFFGAFDAANAITVDKPPAALWVMGLSARLFGVNAWSILVPQALMGVASVGVLYAAVGRVSGRVAGLVAGAVLALTPVATLMFRFNNPDALLTLLLVLAAYATVRAVERASTRWLLVAAALVGTGFLTKMLQAFLVVPAFALAYLVAAPTPLRRRLGQLLAAGGALVVASGWWVAVVELWPAGSRPYVGGSQTNSVLELVFGYNGLGRITGEEVGSVAPGGGQAARWGETGLTRLFTTSYGGQVSWLLPAALILLTALVALTWRAPRTDRLRASVLLWGGWLVVTGLVISFSQGIIHEYYTVALAPAIGALVGLGAAELWRRRAAMAARATLAGAVAVTGWWAWVLLGRSADWLPWLRPAVLVGGMGVAGLLLVLDRLARQPALAVAGAGLLVVLAGPAAYAVQTAATTHSGSLPTAGPSVSGGPGGPGAGAPGSTPGRDGGLGGPPPQAMPGTGQLPGAGGQAAGQGGAGGLLQASTPDSTLVALLTEDADSYTWVAATVGANSAAGYQLATGEPVMAIGGFNGSDPAPTLTQFQAWVAAGRVHWFVGGGGFAGQNGGSAAAGDIAAWVAETYPAQTVGGVTVYDLSG